MWNRKVFIRIIEVLLTLACVITLRVTDDESRRVFAYLRSRSMDWYPLRNVTWGIIGAALATATCGGYLIVTTGLLIASATGELTGRKTELFFLGLGIVLFGIVGSLSLASIEDIPEALIDNAAIFGALCLVTCLVFIADLLMNPPGKQKKHDGTQTYLEKETAMKPTPATTVSLETETRTPISSNNGNAPSNPPTGNRSTATNDHFGDSEISPRSKNSENDQRPSSSDTRDHEERFPKMQRSRSTENREDPRDRDYEHDERQSRHYVEQNFANGRMLRDSQRYRETDDDRRDFERRTNVSRNDDGKMYYNHGREFKQRPADEIDTPLFPSTRDNINEPRFSKIVNPSVKIMRIERDPDDNNFDTRNSDSSQYDNVPSRMSSSLEGILKRRRDVVSFNVPPSLRTFRSQQASGPNKDDIEMLEEWINVLKETNPPNPRTPSSPIDPGYVRHTASNWPRDVKAKTPGTSPNRESNDRS